MLTRQDCTEASALLAARHRLRRLGPVIVIIVSLGIGALVALATVRLGSSADIRRAFGLATALCALFLGMQYLLLLRIAVQMTRRSMESLGWVGRPVTGHIKADGIVIDDGAISLHWPDLRAAIEGPHQFVLLSSANPPIVIPRIALPEPAQILLRTLQVRA
ncbi:MAG: hypothetical protein ACKOPO_12745 [Novosphingobium sp.]